MAACLNFGGALMGTHVATTIASGLADRQISAMAEHLSEKLKDAGLKRVQIEGKGGSDWVLIDAGDIVVHLFKPEARTMYALEKMWGVDLDEAV